MRETAVSGVDLAAGETRVLTQVDGKRANSVREWTRIGVCFLCSLMVRNSTILRAEEWQSYGGNRSNWKYSALQQIDAKNVSRLQIAWRWTPPDATIFERYPKLRSWKYEVTPIIVGNVLYANTPMNLIVAINAASGQTIWVFDPKAYVDGRPANNGFLQRGVAYWTDGQQERIISGTVNGYLLSIDAKTGRRAEGFGSAGRIDLTRGLIRTPQRSLYGVNSPPAVCGDVIIVGSTIVDSPVTSPMPLGDVRGFDVRTGELLWTFHTIPHKGEYGSSTWLTDPASLGGANVWPPMAADEVTGRVYLPVSSPSGDFYGGPRPGDGLFGSSLVCLDAHTGKRIWHFQMVHHDLWDRDPPAAPILTKNAVVQVTKQGFVFVFDRITGKPVWPIVERPVPVSHTLGEHSSPTQPVPTRPPPFDRQALRTEDLIDFTPLLNKKARSLAGMFDHGELFTPPTERGTILLPGVRGGASWAGAAYDPEADSLYVPSVTSPSLIALFPDQWLQWPHPSFKAGQLASLMLPNGLPITKPPYGRVTAFNLETGERRWVQPMGEGPVDHPALQGLHLKHLGWPLRGFPLVTKTLLFVAQEGESNIIDRVDGTLDGTFTNVEPSIQVFDKSTGECLAEIPLPANASGSPMTYRVAGKQYLVVAVGGGNIKAELVALALR